MSEINKVLFLHIPKTAGSSLISSEIGQRMDKRIHSFIGELKDTMKEMDVNSYYKFCFTRNPWDRFSSLYHYFYNMTESHMFYKYNPSIIKVVRKYDSFEKFCLAFPDLNIKNFHFYPQSKYIYSDGVSIPDFIGKVENLNEDVKKLAGILNVNLKRQLPHSNKSVALNYREIYTPKMRDIVASCYPDDANKLGYSF